MKKILVIVLAVILALSLSLSSIAFGAGGQKEVTLAQQASTVQSASYRWGLLDMAGWQGDCGCAYQGKCWCGPASGVSIGRYYREEEEYSDLPVDWPGCSEYDFCYDDMFCNLCSHMGIFPGAPVYYYMYGPGFVAMTKDSDYHNFGYAQDFFSQVEMGNLDDYWEIADSIDEGWPVALLCDGQFAEDITGVDGWPPPGNHWVAIRGYLPPYPPYWYYYAIVCTDSYTDEDDGGTDYLYLDWENLGNVGASTFYLCTIKDTVIEDFEWGNKGTPLSSSGGSIGWTVIKSGSSVAVIDTDVQFTGTRSAKFYRYGNNNVKAYYSLVKPPYIGFYVRKQNAAYAYAYIGDGTHRLYTRINSSQYLQYYDTGWHNVCRLYQIGSSGYLIEYKNINWSTGRYDIYVDGDLKKSGASMQTTTADKNKMCFANLAGSGSFWIDDIFES